MLNKKQLSLWIVLAVVVLAAAFIFLNFRAAKSSTKAENQISTYSFGFEKGESLPDNAELSLVMEARDGLSRKVVRRLERKLVDGPITQVNLEEIVQTDIDHFQVSVSWVDRAVFWTPFLARSNLTVNFVFSSNGDLSWRDEEVVTFTSDQGKVVAVKGDIQLSDTSFGLITWPAYETHLADELAQRIDEAIRRALASPMNPALIADP